MRIISHRSNLNGPDERYDTFSILRALSLGFDVEIDVRFSKGRLWVGHDNPLFPVDKELLTNDSAGRIWFHAKDAGAVAAAPEIGLIFSHWDDDFAVISGEKRLIWLHPNRNNDLADYVKSGAINPAKTIILDVCSFDRPDPNWIIDNEFFAVCTDWPLDWHSHREIHLSKLKTAKT